MKHRAISTPIAVALVGTSLAAAQAVRPINPAYTYLSLREVVSQTFFSQFMGLGVTPAGQARFIVAVDAYAPSVAYTLPAGSRRAFLASGQTISLPTPVVVRGGVTYVPARFFTSIGCLIYAVQGNARVISLSCKNPQGGYDAYDLKRY